MDATLLMAGANLPRLEFWWGYVAIIAVPGPNMMFVAAATAAAGFRRTMPLILAIGCGAACLAAGLHLVLSAALDDRLAQWLAPASGVVLMLLAWRILRLKWRVPGASTHTRLPPTDLAVGFVCGLTNPVTGMFFVSQLISPPLAFDLRASAFVWITILACAVLVLTAAALIFSLPAARETAGRHFEVVKRLFAVTCLTFGAISVWPALQRVAMGA